jgi:Tol biopolymer transport system component
VPVCAEFSSARWSPDGSTILFHDYDGVRTGTTPYLMDANGRNLRPLLPDGSVSDSEWMALGSAWSRDGRVVVLGIVESMTQGTYLVPLDGNSPVRIGGPEEIALAMATQFAWAPAPPSF